MGSVSYDASSCHLLSFGLPPWVDDGPRGVVRNTLREEYAMILYKSDDE